MTISPNKWELDVQGYLNVCNISDSTPRQQIRDFAKGVNDLGLWNSMVCWPLRSSQNAGTGTTAYSLGGLGTFDGTLVDGPIWGVDGVTFANASSQYISLGASQIIENNANYTVMGVAKLVNVAATNLMVISMGNGRASFIGAASNGSTQIRNASGTVDGLFPGGPQLADGPTTSMFASFAAGDASSAKHYINSGTPFSTLAGDYRVRTVTAPERIGSRRVTGVGDDLFWNGDIAAGAMWNVKLTDAQVASVLSLYKTTLGTGLGLP